MPKVRVQPAVENRVTDAGAHRDYVTKTEGEKVDLGVGHVEDSEVRDSEEEVER